ncbi:MAG: ABC transporter substrate-binding protein [Actinomycetota bacterium]|nr:MAG: ABC transporter substrate-binding protein [Actinomycetota bacterium]
MPRVTRIRSAALAVVAGGAALILAACGSAGAAPAASGPVDLTTVTIRTGDQLGQIGGMLAASGQDVGMPYRVEYSRFDSGAPLLEAIRAGASDFGGVALSTTVNAIGAGAPLKVAGIFKQSRGDGLGLLVPQGSPITSVADLRGKTVAPNLKGSPAHLILIRQLKRAGVDPKDVNIVFLAPADAQAALASGRIDAWETWDPYLVTAQRAGAKVIEDSTGLSDGLFTFPASTAALADPGKRAAIADYLQRVDRAYKWRIDNPAAAGAWYASLTKLPVDVATAVIAKQDQRLIPLSDKVVADAQATIDDYVSLGVMPKPVAAKDIFDSVVG